MLLLATSLVGLAAMTNAAYISVPSDMTKMPPMGYTSGTINLDDGEMGKFSFSNLDAYTTADFGAWGNNPSGNTWTRMMAVHVSKGTAGASAIGGMKMTYTEKGGTLGAVVHTNANQVLTPTNKEGYWCGMWSDAQLNMDITKPLELTITADCTSQSSYTCSVGGISAGVDFTATAYFYQIDSSWSNSIAYAQTEVWNPNACYGGTWTNTVADGWKSSGYFATDTVFRPYDNEGFTAYLSDVAFNDWSIGTASYVEIYDADVFSAAGNAYPALTTWVGREAPGSSLGLYATLKSSAGSAGFAAMFCFQSEASFNNVGSIWSNSGNKEYALPNAASDYSSWCDIGCYPNPDCSTTGVPAFTSIPTQWDMMDVNVNMVNDQFEQTNGLYVHTLLVGVPGSSVSAPSVPNIQAAFAFGHLPDAATAFGPSALLGLLALAATLA